MECLHLSTAKQLDTYCFENRAYPLLLFIFIFIIYHVCSLLLQFIGIGYTALKSHQEQAVMDFVSVKNVFVQPTGYGKSLCYRCLPWITGCIALINKVQ